MSHRGKPVILVVDDQTTVVRIMANMLQPEYAVRIATNGEMALEIAATQVPDFILLDMIMPGMSGIEVCHALKKTTVTEQIPVIFMTSMDDKHNEQAGLAARAVDYINKPASPVIVKSRVDIHLSRSRQERFIRHLANGSIRDSELIQRTAQSLLD